MKNLLKLSFVFGLCFSQNVNSQVVIPHPIPCIDITPVTVDTFPSGITANDCIDVDGATVTFKTDQHYSIKAGEYIQFDNNTVITPDDSHLFHAFIEPEEMDLAWYYPNSTPGTVGQYEKLELGVQFDSIIDRQIRAFTSGEAGTTINPFNPEEIDLYAEFWYLFDDEWYGPIRVNGFYYEEYERGATTWDTLANDYNFRIRYAPEFTGTYRCKVSADVGYSHKTTHDFTFECVPSSNKGFVNVGDNKRYFKVGNEPYFPVGQNLTGPNNPALSIEWSHAVCPPDLYTRFHSLMTELANDGGNYFRYIAAPWQTEIEFEHLGNYSNRMTNAWEFDKILDTAKTLDLKMHFNLAIHYTFERPSRHAMTQWDWSKRGDTLSPLGAENLNCFAEHDSGYCYRRELDLEDPLDFLTDSLAEVFYKRRLRYMMARWSYSTEIGVLELLSEANNFGNEAIIHFRETPSWGCYVLKESEDSTGLLDLIKEPYIDNPTGIIPELKAWQIEMCRYIKEDLDVTQHPLAVSYTGEPNFEKGDLTYYSNYVDIATFNHYKLSLDKYEQNRSIVTGKYHDDEGDFYIDKPMMHSEYGPGKGGYTHCDNGVRYIKSSILSPFTGLAGSAMNWHGHLIADDIWQYLEPIKELMEGIPLDAENWEVGEPIVQSDKSVEVLYLQRPKIDGQRKAVGAVCNRTFNYYTQGELLNVYGDTTNCLKINTEFTTNEIYKTAAFYDYTDLEDKIKLPNMGYTKPYRIEWYNGLTGEWLALIHEGSTTFGNLELDYPDTLTGDFDCPILLFKVYPADETFLTPIESGGEAFTLPEFFQKDENIEAVENTNWNVTSIDSIAEHQFQVAISPNPTTNIVNIDIAGEIPFGKIWYIMDGKSEIIQKNKINSPNLLVDLSVNPSGIYYFVIQTDKGKSLTQIIKQ